MNTVASNNTEEKKDEYKWKRTDWSTVDQNRRECCTEYNRIEFSQGQQNKIQQYRKRGRTEQKDWSRIEQSDKIIQQKQSRVEQSSIEQNSGIEWSTVEQNRMEIVWSAEKQNRTVKYSIENSITEQ